MSAIREFHETREREQFVNWACLAENTRGRQRPEEKCDIRTDFQRDRDRILYSKAFRRLKHKTQVFISPEGDYFRTRLTHTLEVSQISRSIARALRLNEDLTEAISLGHDLGHAPFGHAGEAALDTLLQQFAEENFRHNEQSLRVVDHLENDNGLNLTYEVRDGILKHSKGQKNISAANSASDDDLPETAEGRIVRIADRMAYINHDMDDALRAEIIKESEIPKEALDILGFTTSARIGSMITDVISTSLKAGDLRMSEKMTEILNLLKDFLFSKVYSNDSIAKIEEVKAKRMIESMFKYYIEYPDRFPNTNCKPDDPLPRRICDYISGMSDPFAIYQYENIFIPKVWDHRL